MRVGTKGGIYFNATVISNKNRGMRGIRKDKDKKKIRPFIVKVGGLSGAKVRQVLPLVGTCTTGAVYTCFPYPVTEFYYWASTL